MRDHITELGSLWEKTNRKSVTALTPKEMDIMSVCLPSRLIDSKLKSWLGMGLPKFGTFLKVAQW